MALYGGQTYLDKKKGAAYGRILHAVSPLPYASSKKLKTGTGSSTPADSTDGNLTLEVSSVVFEAVRKSSTRNSYWGQVWVVAAATLLTVAYSVSASAQEGHPLKGSWLGTWEDNRVHGEDMLLILDWDGENITGIINPGTDDIPITEASLDPDGWMVRIEADAKDDSGKALHYVIEGHIEDLALPNRSIVGTWSSEEGKGAFEAGRQ